MPKFNVEVSRRFVQTETADIIVEAGSIKEARKIAKERMTSEEFADAWEPSDSSYDQFTIEEVSETKG